MSRAAFSGTVVLRVVAGAMILLGFGGLISSAVVFGQVEGQLANIDATVQNVAKTVTYATESVDATSGALGDGIGSVVTFLNNTATGIKQTSGAIKDAKGSLENASKQVPIVIDGTANTIEGAARSVGTARAEITKVEQQLGTMQAELELKTIQSELETSKQNLSGYSIAVRGDDLITGAPQWSAALGVSEAVIRAEGERMKRENSALVFNIDRIQVTGRHLQELARLGEKFFLLDTTDLMVEGLRANAEGTVWTSVPLDRIQTAATGASNLEVVLGQTRSSLGNSQKEFESLSLNLNWNAQQLRNSVNDVMGVTNQAAQFLDVTEKQLAAVTSSLQDVSREVGSFKGVTQEQIGRVNAGLKETAQTISQISVSTLGGSLLGGLRIYMFITHLLFVLAGFGLFAITLRPSSGGAAAGSAETRTA